MSMLGTLFGDTVYSSLSNNFPYCHPKHRQKSSFLTACYPPHNCLSLISIRIVFTLNISGSLSYKKYTARKNAITTATKITTAITKNFFHGFFVFTDGCFLLRCVCAVLFVFDFFFPGIFFSSLSLCLICTEIMIDSGLIIIIDC